VIGVLLFPTIAKQLLFTWSSIYLILTPEPLTSDISIKLSGFDSGSGSGGGAALGAGGGFAFAADADATGFVQFEPVHEGESHGTSLPLESVQHPIQTKIGSNTNILFIFYSVGTYSCLGLYFSTVQSLHLHRFNHGAKSCLIVGSFSQQLQ
jgi:hypothetical protein